MPPCGCRVGSETERAGTVAGRKLIAIQKHKQYSYNKIKTVTKCYLCTNQDRLSRRQKATHVMYQL